MQESVNKLSMLKVGTILRGAYRIDSYLSSGGFGNTYVATNIEFEERVAVKEFFMKGVTERDDTTGVVSVSNADKVQQFEEQREKFKKEAQRIRKLDNQHIVKVHDLFEENGTAYYVMDFVEGEDLSQRLKRTGKPMAERKVREILLQLLDALKTVHDAGMWHLDIKPANIILDKNGNVKLIDFGASKQFNAQKGGATSSTAICYTNGYAPREQMEQNYDKFGPWTDFYALGATLYNLLTNKRPPMPSDIDDDISQDKHNALPFPATTSNEMRQLVVQMLQTNRMKRPQTVGDIFVPSGKKVNKKAESEETTLLVLPDNKLDEETIEKVGNTPVNRESKEKVMIELPRTNFFEAVKCGLHEKFCYDLGRSRRSEFWWFFLVFILAVPFFSLLSQDYSRLFVLCNIYLLLAFLFAFTRRLHDSGHSGYWCLLCFGPLISLGLAFFPVIPKWILLVPPLASLITIIYIGCMDSEKDENEYGESPKYVLVDKDESTQDTDDDSLIDKLSVFLSKSKNVIILIILVVAIFLSYAIFGGGVTNSSNTENISSSSSESVVEPQSIDLGLSVEWASFNIGARTPYEAGYYYWWASTNPINNESDAKTVYDWDETGQSFKKYNNLGMIISPEDDVAHKALGGGWRVPTPDELYELVNKCTWEEAEYMNMKGYNVIGKNGNKIFLPYVGNPGNAYWMGSYMSNSMSSNNVANFYSLVFSDKTMKEIGVIDENVKICVLEVARNSAAVVRAVKDLAYDVVEVMPEYPGGQDALLNYLSQNIKYPKEAAEKGIEGKVQLSFVVEKDGSISEVEVVKPVDPLLDNEAVRVIKSMHGWIPGRQNDETVRVKYTVPVTFRLE